MMGPEMNEPLMSQQHELKQRAGQRLDDRSADGQLNLRMADGPVTSESIIDGMGHNPVTPSQAREVMRDGTDEGESGHPDA